MSVRNEVLIHDASCVGCGVCVEICPPDVLRLTPNAKAYAAYPEDCEGCFLCELNCAYRAIQVSVVLDSDTRAALTALQSTHRMDGVRE